MFFLGASLVMQPSFPDCLAKLSDAVMQFPTESLGPAACRLLALAESCNSFGWMAAVVHDLEFVIVLGFCLALHLAPDETLSITLAWLLQK